MQAHTNQISTNEAAIASLNDLTSQHTNTLSNHSAQIKNNADNISTNAKDIVDIEEAIENTVQLDLSNYITRDEANLTNYYTKEETDDKFATKQDIQDIDKYQTKEISPIEIYNADPETTVEGALAAISKVASDSFTQIGNHAVTLANYEKRIIANEGSINDLNDLTSNHAATLEDHTAKIAANIQNITTNTNDIDIIETTIGNTIQLDLSGYVTDEELDEKVKDIINKEDIEKYQEKILSNSVVINGSAATTVEGAITSLNTYAGKIAGVADEAARDIENLDNVVQGHTAQIGTLEQTTTSHTGTLENYGSRISVNEANIATNTQNITTNRTDIDTIQTNVIQLDLSGYVQDDELEEIVNGLINQAELNQYQKKSLDTPIKIGSSTSDTTTVEGAIGELNTYAKGISTSVSTAIGELGALTDVVSGHTNSLSTLDTKIDNSVTAINSSLSSKVSSDDFSDYQTDVNDRFIAVGEEVTGIKTSISTINETVNNHTNTLTNQGASITNNANAIAQNTANISTNAGNISTIQSTIDNTVQLDLDMYETKSHVSSIYATKAELQNINLTNYYTIEQTDAAIKDAVDKVDVSGQLGDYAKKSDLSVYATSKDLTDNYLSKNDASTTYATKSSLSGYYSKGEIDNSFVLKSTLGTDYLTKDEIADTYATKTNLDAYTTTTDLQKGYATKDDVKYVPKTTGSSSQLLG